MRTSRHSQLIRLDPGEWHRPRIVKRPGVCGGAACVNGTRLAVSGLEQWRRLGWDEARFLEAYPQLTKEDLAAAWEYVESNREEIDQAIQENEAA